MFSIISKSLFRFSFLFAVCGLVLSASIASAQVYGDVDGDGARDLDDLNAICNGVGTPCAIGPKGVFDPRDLNEDHCIDNDDVFEFRLAYGVGDLNGNEAILYGDANIDGYVDLQDYLIWIQNSFTTGTTWGTADFDCNNATDGTDQLILLIFLYENIFD